MSILQISTMIGVLILLIIGIVVAYRIYYRNRAQRFGYPSRGAYLQAVPRTDAEKREAVDQAFMGLAICLLGLVLFPLLLVGLFPLFVGGRKTTYVLMGLGFIDDADDAP